ncbi:hypothetical protein DSL72_007549 [Monilinia vaccinii-corymbosi]|uniref:Cytochrome b-c1 complex subunit 6, mitochondrial n=1 Tax=Monilinia vaccinii-corymbosi TaxID=61207 RepID=A0A8A3PI50_9HELO|nr:hypothetical protein DSL72_007549 [Monilinia vaccinii-corymbosi]
MGFFNSWSDLVSAATPWSEAEAEAVSGGSSTEKTPAQKDNGGEGEVKDPSGATPEKRAAKDAEEEEEEEEAEEEEEEEMVDPKDKFEEECKESKACAPSKHHYDECVERVTGGKEQHPGEDCVEEFFHLAHCATACAAPKLWNVLK